MENHNYLAHFLHNFVQLDTTSAPITPLSATLTSPRIVRYYMPFAPAGVNTGMLNNSQAKCLPHLE